MAWDAAFACATGQEDRILTLGNPVADANARFRRAHRPGSGWEALRIAAADIPNVRAGREVVPGLLSRRGIEAFKTEYGADSGAVTARVHAEFPEGAGNDRAFPQAWLEAAVRRGEEARLEGAAREGPWIGGLDPAGGGPNESVLALREGPILRELLVLEGQDEALLGNLGRALRERELWERLGLLVVDAVGPGTYLPAWLQERGLPAIKYKGGAGAAEPEEYVNARTEAFWRLRQDLRRGWVALPDDERLLEELAAIRWGVDPKGRIKLEAKKELKARLGRSPDRADALALAFWPEVAPAGGGRDADPLESEVAGNFLEGLMGFDPVAGPADPRQVVDEDRAAGWTPTGPPLPW